ncbi:protein PIGBOS1 [Thalassophryne amazonica]|uniref:protein PIGBOS1 n=1 Tax=Thalassophryne amazonica TaxID=390379 RepID=UPI001471E572|nr:protein PIGBOS1 [Thalassophryne amazonica]
MFRRRIPFIDMVFASLVGVAAGIYIYRPYFEELSKISRKQKQDVPADQDDIVK